MQGWPREMRTAGRGEGAGEEVEEGVGSERASEQVTDCCFVVLCAV